MAIKKMTKKRGTDFPQFFRGNRRVENRKIEATEGLQPYIGA